MTNNDKKHPYIVPPELVEAWKQDEPIVVTFTIKVTHGRTLEDVIRERFGGDPLPDIEDNSHNDTDG